MEDADLPVLFKTLTDRKESEITAILEEHSKQPERREAQEILAGE